MSDPEAATYDLAFAAWAEGVIDRLHAQKPWQRRYAFKDFDGCSFSPDSCLWACLIHDIRYFHTETAQERLEADRDLRDDILSMNRLDRGWRWLWSTMAWTAYGCVRAFGWIWAGKGARMASAASSTDQIR